VERRRHGGAHGGRGWGFSSPRCLAEEEMREQVGGKNLCGAA
jgi:hypothetical protein